jgi:prepilin-type N-terminal cleavage/methylation domain-containing protein
MNKNSGFTLIEFLIGLGIFSVVALSVYGVFWSGLQVQRRVTKMNQISHEVYWTVNRMASDIESMTFYQRNDFSSIERSLWGDTQKIGFFKSGPTGLNAVSYFLKEMESLTPADVRLRSKASALSFAGLSAEAEHERNSAKADAPGKDADKSAQFDRSWALVREERPLRKGLPINSGEMNEDGIEVLSNHVPKDGLSFAYGYLKRTPQQATRLLWEKELKPEDPLWAIRITIIFLSQEQNQKPNLEKKDDFIPVKN